MKIYKAYYTLAAFMLLILFLGVSGLTYNIGEAWGWLPTTKSVLPASFSELDKQFLRVFSILFTAVSFVCIFATKDTCEKYYEHYTVPVDEFEVEEYDNAFIIKVDNKAWALQRYYKNKFLKHLEFGRDIKFEVVYGYFKNIKEVKILL